MNKINKKDLEHEIEVYMKEYELLYPIKDELKLMKGHFNLLKDYITELSTLYYKHFNEYPTRTMNQITKVENYKTTNFNILD